jgi:hypothetical protein
MLDVPFIMNRTILHEQVRVWRWAMPFSFSMTAVVATTKEIRIEQQAVILLNSSCPVPRSDSGQYVFSECEYKNIRILQDGRFRSYPFKQR